MNIYKMLLSILVDQRAENEGAGAGSGEGAGAGEGGGSGQGGAPAEGGQGKAPGAGEGQEGNEGAEGGEGAGEGKPAFGKYKTAEELFTAHQNLTQKSTQTEANAAKLKKTLESAGIKVAYDGQGNMMLVPASEQKQERTKKFNDDLKKKLGLYFGDDPEKGLESAQGFLGLIQPFIEDLLEDQFSNREQEFNQRNSKVTKMRQAQEAANTRMLRMFPALKTGSEENPNPDFNESFYNLATKIWQENEEYKNDPRGELLAALDAADELGIVANAIKQAKQEGFKVGQQGKKILGPVNGGQGKAGQIGKTLTKAEYMALDSSKREEYDRKQLQVAK